MRQATAAARAAKDATSTMPIVMYGVSDALGEGLIASFAHPGGNVTGLTNTPTLEIHAKQLQLLKEAVPRARQVAFLWNPANPAHSPVARTVVEAVRGWGSSCRSGRSSTRRRVASWPTAKALGVTIPQSLCCEQTRLLNDSVVELSNSALKRAGAQAHRRSTQRSALRADL